MYIGYSWCKETIFIDVQSKNFRYLSCPLSWLYPYSKNHHIKQYFEWSPYQSVLSLYKQLFSSIVYLSNPSPYVVYTVLLHAVPVKLLPKTYCPDIHVYHVSVHPSKAALALWPALCLLHSIQCSTMDLWTYL